MLTVQFISPSIPAPHGQESDEESESSVISPGGVTKTRQRRREIAGTPWHRQFLPLFPITTSIGGMSPSRRRAAALDVAGTEPWAFSTFLFYQKSD